jgi:hypothetical protein
VGSLYGFEIKTDLPLRRLNEAAGTRGILVIEQALEPLPVPAGEPEGVLEDERGRRWYASYELDGDCLLRLPPTGSFLLQAGPGRVAVASSDDDPELLEHRIASAAICTLLSMRGDLVLHAAAVEAGGKAILLCGPSRRGKSTLVRELGRAGHSVLGEDGIAIALGAAGAVAHPGAPRKRGAGRRPGAWRAGRRPGRGDRPAAREGSRPGGRAAASRASAGAAHAQPRPQR